MTIRVLHLNFGIIFLLLSLFYFLNERDYNYIFTFIFDIIAFTILFFVSQNYDYRITIIGLGLSSLIFYILYYGTDVRSNFSIYNKFTLNMIIWTSLSFCLFFILLIIQLYRKKK
jgi:hypothetical protein